MPNKDKEQYNLYMNDYMKRRYNKRRIAVIEQFGGQCSRCISKDELQFHHIDRSSKTMTIAKTASLSESRWQEELAKCELLCADCHRKHHKSNHPHGDVKRYWRGCKCELCKQANAEYSRRYRSTR